MKPIKLIMQAFGPYAGREEVDFREAIAAGLFGIYGPTGSGKSSIFSAITFALFGQAAKNEQAIATLRSDHAATDCPTEVEFLFELGGKLYYVRRRPDQERPKASGDGLTKDQHAAWLFDATGLEIDSINADNCGKPLAEKKVGTVAEEIHRLLGYGAEQFRQIVLLPQGRFEAFLAAKSDERLTILSKLFDVSLYRRLSEKMASDAREAEQKVVDGRKLCSARLQQENCESEDALRRAIQEAADQAAQLAAASEISERTKARADAALANGKAVEAQFVAHRAAVASMEKLELINNEMAALRLRLELAKVAKSLGDIDRELTDASSALQLAQQSEAGAKKADEDARRNLARAKEALGLEDTRSLEIASLQKEHDALLRYAEVLKTAEGLKAEAALRAEALQNATNELHGIESGLAQLNEQHLEAQVALKLANQNHSRRSALEARLQTANASLDTARMHDDATKNAASAAEDLSEANRAAAEASAATRAAEDAHEVAARALENSQAQLLAKSLVAGEPCLVCGSCEHPFPAIAEGDLPEVETTAKKTLAELEACRAAEGKTTVIAATAEGKLAALAATLSGLQAPKQSLDALLLDIDAIIGDLAGLGPHQDVTKIEAEIAAMSANLAAQTKKQSIALKANGSASNEAAVSQNALELALRDVPEEFRNVSVLASRTEQVLSEIENRERQLKDAQALEKEAGLSAISARKDFENAAAEVTKAQGTVETCSRRFSDRLSDAGLTVESYAVHKADIVSIAEFERTATEHDRQLDQARGSVMQAELAIKGIERPNLSVLTNAQIASEAEAKAASGDAAKARARLTILETLARELADEFARLNRLEEETGPLRALAAAFKGDNSIKTTLESYAIGAMFDQVVAAANLRLVPMTSAQYRFERDSETVSGRSKRGLDIRVHDVHTGRTRDISTLSGGESFIAALALALGLSDVVEMSSGNIRLDTIFIDEGFGSLDTDNDSGTLDRVLQVLQDIVGQNRAVGLISHVPLVQQAIPNGFTIRKTQAGSSIEVRMS